MRVPDSVFQNLSLRSLTGRRADYLKAQQQALTGKRVEKPSDDPIAAARARKYESQRTEAEGHEQAIEHARSSLLATDDALSQVSETMRRAREIATQAGNGTLSAAERDDLAKEVEQLQNHLGGLANTKVGGRFLFGGYADDQAPFDATGNYLGDSGVQDMVVGRGVRVPLGVAGDQVFAVTGPGNAFEALETLRQGLATNDTTQIQDALERTIAAGDVVTDQWAEVGTQLQSIDVAASVADRVKAHAVESIARETEVDPFEALSALANAQSALSAAVQIASMLPPPGLTG